MHFRKQTVKFIGNHQRGSGIKNLNLNISTTATLMNSRTLDKELRSKHLVIINKYFSANTKNNKKLKTVYFLNTLIII